MLHSCCHISGEVLRKKNVALLKTGCMTKKIMSKFCYRLHIFTMHNIHIGVLSNVILLKRLGRYKSGLDNMYGKKCLSFFFSSCLYCCWILLSTLLSWWNTTDSEADVQMVTVRSNPGMRTSCNLPDGTVAYLNSGSTLIYPVPYDKDKRAVTLDGEGYFKVTHDSKKPFIVSVADGK